MYYRGQGSKFTINTNIEYDFVLKHINEKILPNSGFTCVKLILQKDTIKSAFLSNPSLGFMTADVVGEFPNLKIFLNGRQIGANIPFEQLHTSYEKHEGTTDGVSLKQLIKENKENLNIETDIKSTVSESIEVESEIEKGSSDEQEEVKSEEQEEIKNDEIIEEKLDETDEGEETEKKTRRKKKK